LLKVPEFADGVESDAQFAFCLLRGMQRGSGLPDWGSQPIVCIDLMAGLVPAIDVLPAVVGHAFDCPSLRGASTKSAARAKPDIPSERQDFGF
jgi:hypothetical protein